MPFPADGPEDADGAEWLFDVLVTGTAEAYQKFAEEYYEWTPGLTAIRRVYGLKPLTPGIVAALNPQAELRDLAARRASCRLGTSPPAAQDPGRCPDCSRRSRARQAG